MRTDKWLLDTILIPIYRQMYKEAEPSADFDELVKSGEAYKPRWFEKYFLSLDRQIEIRDKFYKKYKLTKRERERVDFEVFLGCSPNSYKGD